MKYDQNTIELDAILYYADYLSLRAECTTVTDNCVYYYIYGTPINCARIYSGGPFFDENNPYLAESVKEYNMIREKYDDDGVKAFLEDLCALKYTGKVTGYDMLKYIHMYSDKKERKHAYKKYQNYDENIKYKHAVRNDDGDIELVLCSRYIAHLEKDSSICERPTV